MAETKPIPVRLSEDITKRLDAAAKRIGSNRAGMIRMLIDTWLNDFESKGVASLPPNWEEIMASADNRTKESREVNSKTTDSVRKYRQNAVGKIRGSKT